MSYERIVRLIVIALGLLLGALRIMFAVQGVEPEPFNWFDFYKDMAHVFIGGLIISWWNNSPPFSPLWMQSQPLWPWHARAQIWFCLQFYSWQWNLAWFLIVLEIITATLTRI